MFNCPQIWTVARLTYKNQKCFCELFISKYFFSESNFCTITSHFFNPISKMFCNFLLQLNMEKRRHAFLALFVLKPRKNINWRKPNSLWLVASKRWLGRLHLVAVKKLAIHFISKFLVWFDSQLFKLLFDMGLRYLQLKPDSLHRLDARHPRRYTVTLSCAFVNKDRRPN